MATNRGNDNHRNLSVHVLETRRLTSRRGRACSLPRLQGRLFPASASVWGLQVALGLSLPSLPPCPCGFSCVCVSPLLSLMRTPVPGCRATFIHNSLISGPSHNYICNDFQTKSVGVIIPWTHLFGGHHSTPLYSYFPLKMEGIDLESTGELFLHFEICHHP